MKEPQGLCIKSRNTDIWKEFNNNRKTRHCFISACGEFIYHLGVIDYLQDFNIEKWGENKYKSLISDGEMISAVKPSKYVTRFFNFMQRHVVINQELEEQRGKEINLQQIQKKFISTSFHKRKLQ